MDEHPMSNSDLFATNYEGIRERKREFGRDLAPSCARENSLESEGANVIVEDNGLTGAAFEQSLVTQFIKLLGMRHKQSVLLSDLGALMNEKLRLAIKDKGGLRTWVQKYSNHFSISGHPGKEHVSLVVPGNENDKENIDSEAKGNHDDSGNQEDTDGSDENMSAFDMQPILQLRGLPYRAQYEDIVNFLGTHAHFLKPPRRNSVQLVLNRDGRPSGFARVHFSSAEAAKACKELLHMQPMEERYVEVFLYNSERLNKKKKDDKAAAQAMAKSGTNEVEVTSNKEEVVIECVRYLKQQGKGVLLSMLGVALSQASRQFLKQTDQGLKHFLADVPELSVEGTKGCECVCFIEDSSRRKQATHHGEERNALQEKTIFSNAIPPHERNAHNGLQHTSMPVYPPLNASRMGACPPPGVSGAPPGNVSSYHHLGPPQNLSLLQNIPAPGPPSTQNHGVRGQGGEVNQNHVRYQPNLEELLLNRPPAAILPQSPTKKIVSSTSTTGNRLSPPGLDEAQKSLLVPSPLSRYQNTPSNWGTPMPIPPALDHNSQFLDHNWVPPPPGTAAASAAAEMSNNQVSNILGAAPGGPMWPSAAPTSAQWEWANASPSVWNSNVNPTSMVGSQLDPDSLTYAAACQAAQQAQQHLHFSSNVQQQHTHPHISPETFDWSAHVPPPSTPNVNQEYGILNSMLGNVGGPTSMNIGSMHATNNHQQQFPIGAPTSGRTINKEGATVLLRGLPFTSCEDDVLTFFAQHDVVQSIAPIDGAVRMEVKPNGKPAGTAIVQLNSPEDMHIVKESLNDRWIGGRYIEVFTESEYKSLSMNYKNNDAGGWHAPDSVTGKDVDGSAGNGITEDALAKFNLENEAQDSSPALPPLPKLPKSEVEDYEDVIHSMRDQSRTLGAIDAIDMLLDAIEHRKN